MAVNNPLTVFHVTHIKSGSQWVYTVLEKCAPDRTVRPRVRVAHFQEDAILPGKIYPTVYLPYDRFEAILRPQRDLNDHANPPSSQDPPAMQNWYNFQVLNQPTRVFVVIRDLRDALVSLYFSLKVSHSLISDNVIEGHRKLNELNFEDGFLYLLEKRSNSIVSIQHSWLEPCRKKEALMLRYEDLIADEQIQFAHIVDYCQLDIRADKLEKIVTEYTFSNQAAGRKPGVEDISSHFRKGIAGDWKNHFTPRIKSEFKRQFGQLLIQTGYEKNLDW